MLRPHRCPATERSSLAGEARYVLHFEKAGLPPVDAFWSITVYDAERGGFLHPNAHDRYRINNTLASRNADGTVTITFKRACEATDLNCLDVPAGRFEVVPRYYLPHAEIVAGVWTLPKIELVAK